MAMRTLQWLMRCQTGNNLDTNTLREGAEALFYCMSTKMNDPNTWPSDSVIRLVYHVIQITTDDRNAQARAAVEFIHLRPRYELTTSLTEGKVESCLLTNGHPQMGGEAPTN